MRLVLIGGGELDYIEKIHDLSLELNLGRNVIYAGVRSDVPALYNAMDAFVLPSLFEGLPVVLVEAQCAGLPCFVSDTVDPDAAFAAERRRGLGQRHKRGELCPRCRRPAKGACRGV